MDDRAPQSPPGPMEDAPLRALISDIVTRVTVLLRKEMDLARSEVAENLNRAAFGAGLLVVAVIVALTALNVLAVAAVIGLMNAGLDPVWAVLAIGGAALVLALVLALIGVRRVKPANIAPTRSLREMRRTTETAKEAIHA